MLVTVPDADLSQLLASPALLAQTWPSASQEVMMLVHVLRISVPSLAEALTVGLLKLVTPPTGRASADVGLAYKRAVLNGVARRGDGARVMSPHARPSEVTCIDVRGLVVAGRASFGMAG
jgi:hypothetical protein